MGNVIDYIKKYGNLTFLEFGYNEIDDLVLAILSYVDFDGILEDEKNIKVKLSDAAQEFFNKYTKKELTNNVLSVQVAIKVLDAIKDTKRYQDLKLYNYSYKYDKNQQFSALFIDINDTLTYISYEGTDDLISGWKEDAALSYEFPVPSQRDAIKYLNRKVSLFSKRKYIIGGHSKGGNLALVAAMYANPLIRHKIKHVISYDGPGVKQKQIESKKYKRILLKYDLIIPNYSVVGLLLRHEDNYKVILSNKKNILAHNVLTWQISDNKFVETTLSDKSKKLDKAFTNWLNSYNDEQRKKFVKEIFEVFERAGIDSLLDIKEATLPSIINIIRETKKLDPETRKIIQDFVKFIFDYLKGDAHLFLQKALKQKNTKNL